MFLGPVEIKRRTRASVEPTLNNVLRGHDIVGVVQNSDFGDVLLVTPKGGAEKYFAEATKTQPATSPPMGELGASGTKWRRIIGGDEYNEELQGQDGLEIYEKMRRGDATVRASLKVAKTPVLGGRWYIEPSKQDDDEAEKIAKFVSDCLFKRMSISWIQVLLESLLCLDFGWYAFEKVFTLQDVEGTDRWIWQKWAPRHPYDATSITYDQHGGPESVDFMGWESGKSISIPISRLLVFTHDREAGNLEGISVLRSAYKHWYFKDNLYKIDAIQKERHGIGIPVIKLPPGFTTRDKQLAQNLGRNLRTNEQAHVVLPPNWELTFAKVEGQPVNAMESAEHHDKKIYDNVLGQFLHGGGNVGKENEIELYMKASRYIADVIAEVINQHAIPELVKYNYDVDEFPTLRVRRIGETTDWRTMSFAIRNFIGAKVIVPDDKLEEWVREEMDLPRADEESARETETPQMPGEPEQPGEPKVGMPRQAKPGVAAGGSKPNAGFDRSGGG